MMIDFEIHSGHEDSFYVYSHEKVNSRDSYFLEVLQKFGVFFDLPTEYPVNDDEQRIRLIGDHSGLQGIIESFPEEIGVTVERLDTFGSVSNRTVIPPALTSRQQEAVTVACEVGYYDVPRTGSMDDIASQLGCTKSTASQILRRAESSVMDAMKE